MVKLHLSTKILLAILLLLPAISWGQNNTGIVRHRDYQKLAQYNPYQLRIDSSFVVLEDLNEKKEINNIVATKQLYKSNLLVLKEDSEVFNKRESPHFVYPDWKLTDNLFELLHQPKSTKNIVIFVFSQSIANISQKLQKHSEIQVYPILNDLLKISCPINVIFEELIYDSNIMYLGLESTSPERFLNVFDRNPYVNSLNRLERNRPELKGNNMWVSIREPFFDETDMDLAGKEIDKSEAEALILDHTTEMAKIIAGTGTSFILGKGVAPEAAISSSAYKELFPDDISYFNGLNIRVQNHSYGTEMENFYGALAYSYDVMTHENPSILHIFSAGNTGLETTTTGPYAGIPSYSTLTGNFKTSKNTLLVGAVDTIGRYQLISSRGPTFDGRIKPEIMAYSSVGTSNAAALVSGTSLLLYEAYQEKYGEWPSSALIKGILINSADDLGSQGPDHTYGFGQMNAFEAMETIESHRFITDSISTESEKIFIVDLPENISQFKITLSWNDPAADINSFQALVNDLDILLINQEGDTLLPWVLSSLPAQLDFPATRGNDSINNVEQITWDNPTGSQVSIMVRSKGLFSPRQTFHLSYLWEMKNEFQWISPMRMNNFPFDGKTGDYIRWKSTLNESIGQLSYRILPNGEWNMIEEEASLAEQNLRWLPAHIEGLAQLKMKIASQEFLSDTFKISRPLPIQTAFNCSDSVMIAWPESPNAVGYRLYRYNNNEMELVETLTDNSYIFDPMLGESGFFSVEAFLSSGESLIRSEATNFENVGNSCYVNSFFAVLDEEESKIYLELDLGSNYLISEINFYRLSTNEIISSIQNPASLSFRLQDPSPQIGYNEYKLEIIFENQQSISAHSSPVYLLDNQSIFLFPNPVEKGQDITIYFSNENNEPLEVQVVSSFGRIVFQQEITSPPFSLNTQNLGYGIYFVRIKNSHGVATKRILVDR